jgi:hypothetical protein
MTGHRTVMVATAAIAAAAAVCVWYASAAGIGLSPDSVVYVETARSLLRGDGLESGGAPLTHFPPLYPLLLAVFGAAGGDVLVSARVLHALLWAVVILLASGVAWSASGRVAAAALPAAVFLAAAAGLIEIHSTAWSEAPFFVFLLAAWLAIDRYLAGRGRGWLIAAGCGLGAAALTRYVGIVLVAPAVICVWLFGAEQTAKRDRPAFVLACVAWLPPLLWLVRNAVLVGTATNRTLTIHPPDLGAVREGVYTVSYWFFPPPVLAAPVRALVALLGLVVLTGSVMLGLRSLAAARRRGDGAPLRSMLALSFVFYGSFLLFSRTFLDAHTKFDNRILSPLLLAGVLLACAAPAAVGGEPRLRAAAGAVAVVVTAAVLGNLPWTVHVIRDRHTNGFGYSSPVWRDSPTLGWLRGLPAQVPVFSNAPESIRLYLDRRAAIVPRLRSPTSGRQNPDLENEVGKMVAALTSDGGLVVYFDAAPLRPHLPSSDHLRQLADLVVLLETEDGLVLGARDAPPPINAKAQRREDANNDGQKAVRWNLDKRNENEQRRYGLSPD